jgi:capsular exopolysaccharide synthesis family protein
VEEVERIVKAPALTVNPVDHATARAGPQEAGLVVLKRPSSALAESFRHLRASVLLSTAPSQPARTLLVTSARIEEGRTSTATNLAISFAQGGGAVLIVDADLRRPAVAGTFGVSNERGLSSVLTGVLTLEEVLVRNDRIPNLWVLPAGPRPADPADLLSSHMMEATIKDLAKRFTQIVIDSPPLLVETDAVALSPKVEGVILVVASGTTARGDLRRAHRILESAGARLLGTVLNNVDMRFDDYNGSYYGPYHQLYHDPTSVPGPSRWPEADGPQAKVPPRKP